MKSLTSGCVQVSPLCQKSSRASLLRNTHSITCGDICRTTRIGRLLARTVGASEIETEKLGCVLPGRKKYLARGTCSPIGVEIKIDPAIPVWAVVRFAISTTMSLDNSSAN